MPTFHTRIYNVLYLIILIAKFFQLKLLFLEKESWIVMSHYELNLISDLDVNSPLLLCLFSKRVD